MISSEGGNGSVVGAGESDEEGAGIGEASSVLDLVVNGDGLDLTFCQSVVGGISGVKGPGAIGADGEALNGNGFVRCWIGDGIAIAIGDGCGKEGIGSGVTSLIAGVDVSGGERSC